MARSRFNQKTLLNAAAVALLLMIVLSIGVFIGKTLNMNASGNIAPASGPSATPGNDYNVIAPLPSGSTVSPIISATPTPSPASGTQAPSPSTSPTTTATPTATATATSTPTPTPTSTPTPTPTPAPVGTIQDAPFYENYTTLKEGDHLQPVQSTFIPGNGPLYLDIANSNMGRDYAYAGDTIGVGLKIYNDGPAMNKTALVTMNLSRKIYPISAQPYWVDDIIPGRQFTTQISAGDHASFTKNLSYTVPRMTGISGVYKITVRFYVDGNFNAGFVKELNIFD